MTEPTSQSISFVQYAFIDIIAINNHIKIVKDYLTQKTVVRVDEQPHPASVTFSILWLEDYFKID